MLLKTAFPRGSTPSSTAQWRVLPLAPESNQRVKSLISVNNFSLKRTSPKLWSTHLSISPTSNPEEFCAPWGRGPSPILTSSCLHRPVSGICTSELAHLLCWQLSLKLNKDRELRSWLHSAVCRMGFVGHFSFPAGQMQVIATDRSSFQSCWSLRDGPCSAEMADAITSLRVFWSSSLQWVALCFKCGSETCKRSNSGSAVRDTLKSAGLWDLVGGWQCALYLKEKNFYERSLWKKNTPKKRSLFVFDLSRFYAKLFHPNHSKSNL